MDECRCFDFTQSPMSCQISLEILRSWWWRPDSHSQASNPSCWMLFIDDSKLWGQYRGRQTSGARVCQAKYSLQGPGGGGPKIRDWTEKSFFDLSPSPSFQDCIKKTNYLQFHDFSLYHYREIGDWGLGGKSKIVILQFKSWYTTSLYSVSHSSAVARHTPSKLAVK